MKGLLRHLDNPVRILSFSVNDLMGYMMPFVIGALFNSLLVIPTIGLIIVYFGKKALRRFPKFYLIRSLYWSLPTSKYNKLIRISWPSSSKRLWVK
jgi:type IV conjugative transfer system protein TraL